MVLPSNRIFDRSAYRNHHTCAKPAECPCAGRGTPTRLSNTPIDAGTEYCRPGRFCLYITLQGMVNDSSANEVSRDLREGSGCADRIRACAPRTSPSVSGQLRIVPTPAHCFHQQHAGIHAPALDVNVIALIGQSDRLSGDDLQIIIDAAFIAIGKKLE
jgi:hypothetical protein